MAGARRGKRRTVRGQFLVLTGNTQNQFPPYQLSDMSYQLKAAIDCQHCSSVSRSTRHILYRFNSYMKLYEVTSVHRHFCQIPAASYTEGR